MNICHKFYIYKKKRIYFDSVQNSHFIKQTSEFDEDGIHANDAISNF